VLLRCSSAELEHAGIEQTGDVRVIQLSEKAAFAAKSLFAVAPQPDGVHEFDGDYPLIPAVGAMRAPHAAHAAAADFGIDHVLPDVAPDQRCRCFFRVHGRGACKELGKAGHFLRSEQSCDLRGQRRVFSRQFLDPPGALRSIEFQDLIEEFAQGRPSTGGDECHRTLLRVRGGPSSKVRLASTGASG
jgi:hypothetical protein